MKVNDMKQIQHMVKGKAIPGCGYLNTTHHGDIWESGGMALPFATFGTRWR
jgi:hypothetical protein